MGEIMARMSDAKQLALQRTERDLCDHLNALAACLTAAAGALIAFPHDEPPMLAQSVPTPSTNAITNISASDVVHLCSC